jgi:hypothetical protein
LFEQLLLGGLLATGALDVFRGHLHIELPQWSALLCMLNMKY